MKYYQVTMRTLTTLREVMFITEYEMETAQEAMEYVLSAQPEILDEYWKDEEERYLSDYCWYEEYIEIIIDRACDLVEWEEQEAKEECEYKDNIDYVVYDK